MLSSFSAPTTHLLPRSISLTCVGFMCLAPSCHCLFGALKVISVFLDWRPSDGVEDVILVFFPSTGPSTFCVLWLLIKCLSICLLTLSLKMRLFFSFVFPSLLFFPLFQFVCIPECFFLHFVFFPLRLNSQVTKGGCEPCLAGLGSLEAKRLHCSRIYEDPVTNGGSSAPEHSGICHWTSYRHRVTVTRVSPKCRKEKSLITADRKGI